jgi:HEAT repeat protein/beta-lactamase regulating signal transducer with metallopeptidase domain
MSAPFWVLATLLKLTALLLGVVVVAALLRRGSAALRHLVWGMGIVTVLLLPLVSLALPWQLAVVPVEAAVGVVPQTAVEPIPPATSARHETPAALDRVPGAPQPSPSGTTLQTPERGRASLSPATIVSLLLLAWGLGAAYLLGRLALGALVLRRVVRRGTPLETPDWRRPLLEAADRLALPELPMLVMSDRFPMPFACGIVRPAIVLPSGAAEWDDRRRRTVLVHELAHLARRDLMLNAVGQVTCALYWFHPLVWMAARKLRIESERACDDLVLGVGTRPSEYADHLLQIVCRASSSRTPAVALPMAQRHEFEGRMLAILERVARREPASGRHALVLGALALLLIIPIAALAPAQLSVAPPVPSTAGAVTVTDTAWTPADTVSKIEVSRPPVRPPAAPTTKRGATPVPAPITKADTNAVATALIRALEDSVASVREDAAYALGQLQASSAIAPLMVRLGRDPAPKVREMIAWALGQIESRSATEGLAATAQRDSSEEVRAMAVWAMAQVQDPAAMPALTALLRDRSEEVRGRAAWAIGTIQPSTSPPGLVEVLDDASADVRLRAAWAIGQIADPSAVPRLSSKLRDASAEVRRAAMWALGQIGGEPAEGALLKALEDPDPEVRARAARALAGNSGDPWPWPWPIPIIR